MSLNFLRGLQSLFFYRVECLTRVIVAAPPRDHAPFIFLTNRCGSVHPGFSTGAGLSCRARLLIGGCPGMNAAIHKNRRAALYLFYG